MSEKKLWAPRMGLVVLKVLRKKSGGVELQGERLDFEVGDRA